MLTHATLHCGRSASVCCLIFDVNIQALIAQISSVIFFASLNF